MKRMGLLVMVLSLLFINKAIANDFCIDLNDSGSVYRAFQVEVLPVSSLLYQINGVSNDHSAAKIGVAVGSVSLINDSVKVIINETHVDSDGMSVATYHLSFPYGTFSGEFHAIIQRTSGVNVLPATHHFGEAWLVNCNTLLSQISVDHDTDGYHSGQDCDDNNSAIHPDATEMCGDGIDQDCNGNSNDVCINQSNISGYWKIVSDADPHEDYLSLEQSNGTVVANFVCGIDNSASELTGTTQGNIINLTFNTNGIIYSFSGNFTSTSMTGRLTAANGASELWILTRLNSNICPL